MVAIENLDQHPWLGLAPYGESDAAGFFGRSAEINELSTAITDFATTVIYGPSGTGKTSILKAGVFPRLKEKNFWPLYVRFSHSENALSYPAQLMNLLKAEFKAHNIEIVPVTKKSDTAAATLWELLHENEFWSAQNQLIKPIFVIDQFEEIFTLTSKKVRVADFIVQLGDICNNTIPVQLNLHLAQTGKRLDYPIENQNYRVVISLREDFLARLEELTVTIPVLKRNRYSLQAFNGEQAMEAILGPGGQLVNTAVAQTIVQRLTATDDGEKPDLKNVVVEPALLSLFCSELNSRRLMQQLPVITVELVETSGSDIIKYFYNDTISGVSEKTAFFIEDNLLTASGFRNSIAMDDVLSAGVPEPEIKLLTDKRLLRIEKQMGITRVEFTHDILTAVAKEKRDNRRFIQKVESDKKQLQALQEEKDKQRKKTKKYVLISTVLFTLLVGLFIAGYFLFFHRYEYKYAHVIKRWGIYEGSGLLTDEQASHRESYFKLTKKGLYTFSFKKKPFIRLCSMNGYGQLTTDNNLGMYLAGANEKSEQVSEAVKEKIKSVCQWSITYNEEEKPVYEMGFDKDTNMVWGFIYAPSYAKFLKNNDADNPAKTSQQTSTGQQTNTGQPKTTRDMPSGNLAEAKTKSIVGHFVDDVGLLMQVRNGGANYVRISYDRNGFDSLLEYYDEFGAPSRGPDSAFATVNIFNEKGFPVKTASLDAFGDYMIDAAGNTGLNYYYDSDNNDTLEVSFGKNGEKRAVYDGNTIWRSRFDKFGNEIEWRLYDSTGLRPFADSDGVNGVQTFFNSRGADTAMIDIDTAGKPVKYAVKNPDVIPVRVKEYDADGNLTAQSYYTQDNGIRKPLNRKDDNYFKYVVKYNKFKKITEKFWYNASLKLISDSVFGYSGFRTWYDAEGNDTVSIYYNSKNVPSKKYDIIRKKYENGLLVSHLRYDNKNVPTDSMGIHGWIIKRNFATFVDTVMIVDTMLHPNKISNYAFKIERYSDKGFKHQLSEEYYDPLMHRVNIDGAKKEWRYDSYGHKVDVHYFGIAGKQCDSNFYFHEKRSYNLHNDQRDQLMGIKVFKENDEVSFYDTLAAQKLELQHIPKPGTVVNYYSEDGSAVSLDTNTHYHKAIYISAILNDTAAAALAGLHENDIIIEWNNWRYDYKILNGNILAKFESEMNKPSLTSTITVVRLSDKTQPIKHYHLPVSFIGIHYNFKYLTKKEYEKLGSVVAK